VILTQKYFIFASDTKVRVICYLLAEYETVTIVESTQKFCYRHRRNMYFTENVYFCGVGNHEFYF